MKFQNVTNAEFRFEKVTGRSPVKEKAPTGTL